MALALPGVEASGASASDSSEPAPRSVAELKTRLEALLEDTGVPGLGIALVATDEVLWVEGLGAADVRAGEEMTADSLLRIGSVSKVFTSLAVLRLVEQGRLALEDEARARAPDVEWTNRWSETDPIRIEHLLEHTAGFDDIHLAEYGYSGAPGQPLSVTLSLHPDSRTSRWRPGTFHSYSNSGPAVAARIVEVAAGESFEAFARREILEPLGMDRTTFFEPADGLAKGYLEDGREGGYWEIIYRPSGAMNSSPREMGALAQMLLGRGRYEDRELFSARSIERMERSETTSAARAGLAGGYGLGNYTAHHEGHLFHGHAGGVDTFVSELGYSPEIGRGYFVAINEADGDAMREIRRLVRGFLTSDIPRPPRPVYDAADEDRFTGYYRPIAPRIDRMRGPNALFGVMKVSSDENGLVVKPLLGGETRPLKREEANLFREPQHAIPTLAFLPDADGRMRIHGTSGLLDGVHERVSAPQAIGALVLALLLVLVLASPLLLPLVWLPRRLMGRRGEVGALRTRGFAVVTTCLFLGMVACLVLGIGDPLGRLARPSFASIGFAICGWLFGLSSIATAVVVWRERRRVGPVVNLYTGAVSAAALATAVVLLRWGILGLRTWAY